MKKFLFVLLPCLTLSFFIAGSDRFAALKKAAARLLDRRTATFMLTSENRNTPYFWVHPETLKKIPHGHARAQALGVRIQRGEWGSDYTVCKIEFNYDVYIRSLEEEGYTVSFVVTPILIAKPIKEYASEKKAHRYMSRMIRTKN